MVRIVGQGAFWLLIITLGACRLPPVAMQVVATDARALAQPRQDAPAGNPIQFGTPVQARAGTFWQPDDWRQVSVNDVVLGWVREDALLGMPAQGVKRFVQTVDVEVSNRVDESVPQVLEIGQVVDVILPTGVLLKDGRVTGMVPTDRLGSEPPPLENFLERVRTLLSQRKVPQAHKLLESADRALPGEPLVMKLLDATQPSLGTPHPPSTGKLPPLPVGAVRVGRAYVDVVEVVVTQHADPGSRVVGTLTLAQPVLVLAIVGRQAQISATLPALIDAQESLVRLYPEARLSGFVPLSALHPRQRYPDEITAQAEKWRAAGEQDLAFHGYYRFWLTTAGATQKVEAVLVELALQTGELAPLKALLDPMTNLRPAVTAGVEAGGPFLLGCRSRIIRDSVAVRDVPLWEPMQPLPEGACLVTTDLRPFCAVDTFDRADGEDQDARRERLRLSRDAQAEAQRTQGRMAASVGKLVTRFPGTGYAHFSVAAPESADGGAARPWFLYRAEVNLVPVPGQRCHNVFKVDTAGAWTAEVPVPSNSGEVMVWMATPARHGLEVGVVQAEDEAAFNAWMEQRAGREFRAGLMSLQGPMGDEDWRGDVPEDLAERVSVLAWASRLPADCGPCGADPRKWIE